MGHAVERDQVMFTGRPHLDVLDQHKLVMTDVECRGEHVFGLDAQPCERLGVCPGHPGRSVTQAIAIGILANRKQELPHRSFRAWGVEPGRGPRRWQANRVDAHRPASEAGRVAARTAVSQEGRPEGWATGQAAG